MKNVIIFGTGATSKILISGLKHDVNIVCYCDNDKSKWEKWYNNRKVISPDDIRKFDFNYILVASQFNNEIYSQLIRLNIDQNKIFDFFQYIDSFGNYVKDDMDNLFNNKEKVEGIITGISYAERGIKEELLTKKNIKMAKQSQDLYYDYNLVKYAIEKNTDEFVNLKYVLINLCYYSFEYDMSYSSLKGKVPLYYEVIGKEHHFVDIENYMTKENNNRYIGERIFDFNSNGFPKIDILINNSNKNINVINEEIGKKQALIDCNKNYPKTVKENIGIFKDYLELLKKNKIKPVVIVCPVSKYYSKCFDTSMKEEFHNIINNMKKSFNFKFLDYFNSELFTDSDFYDVSHLNDVGAEKFTKILNNDIDWEHF